jgi:predicted ATPase
MPESVNRIRAELDLRITLGRCITILHGFAAPEVAELYERARTLSGLIGDTHSHFYTLTGLWEYHEVRGDLAVARHLAHEALRLAEVSGEVGLRIKAYDVLADGSHYTGEFSAGHDYAERGISLYRSAEHGALADEFGGYDPGVACRSEGALSLWFLGYSEQARRRSAEGIELARRLHRPFSIALALGYATWLEAYRHDAEATAIRARQLEAFCIDNGFEYFLAHARVLGGWARARTHDAEGGLAQIRSGIDAYANTGATLDRPLWLGLLADALRVQRKFDDSLLATEDGLSLTERTQANFWKAELLRMRGHVLLASDPSQREAAERSIREGIACA